MVMISIEEKESQSEKQPKSGKKMQNKEIFPSNKAHQDKMMEKKYHNCKKSIFLLLELNRKSNTPY